MVVWDGDGNERVRTFPRQRRDRRLCIADFFRPIASGEQDVIGMHVEVTMGLAASEATAELFADNRYREYLELHGVTVEMAEALAVLAQRVRQELGIAGDDAAEHGGPVRPGLPGLAASRSATRPAPTSRSRPSCSSATRWAHRGRAVREVRSTPEQSTSAIIVHHPEAKYFNAR